MIQFTKPKKIVNTLNPGSHFMNNTMYDAKDTGYFERGHGSAFSGSSFGNPGPIGSMMNGPRNQPLDMFSRTHDPISYISPDRVQAAMNNMPIPVGMFMNMPNVQPRYFQQQQAVQAAKQARRIKPGVIGSKPKPRPIGPPSSQINTSGAIGTGSLTQGMSQNMSQPGFSLSQQPDFSQDYMAEYQSQVDGLLSQESNFGPSQSAVERLAFDLPPNQFSQPYW